MIPSTPPRQIQNLNNITPKKTAPADLSPKDSISAKVHDLGRSSIKHAPHRSCKKLSSTPRTNHRIVSPHSANLSPSLQADPAQSIMQQRMLTRHHAEMRIQIFYMCALYINGLGVRSDETQRKVEVAIGHARLQCGQGSNGNHAAHDNAAAGGYDNLKQLFMQEVITEKLFTDKKKKFLLERGFSEETFLQLIALSTDESAFQQFFNYIWNSRNNEPAPVFEGTPTENYANATTELPRTLNLVCDKRLENYIRPIVCNLYKSIMLKDKKSEEYVSPEEATEIYKALVKGHFETAIPKIEQRLADMDAYIINLTILREKKYLRNDKEKWVKLIDETANIKKGLSKNIHDGVPKVEFKGVGYLFEKTKETSTDDLVLSVKTKLQDYYEKIKTQVDAKKEMLNQLLQFTKDESEGTIIPPFELYKRVKNNQSFEEIDLPNPRLKRQENSSITSSQSTSSSKATEPLSQIENTKKRDTQALTPAFDVENVENMSSSLPPHKRHSAKPILKTSEAESQA